MVNEQGCLGEHGLRLLLVEDEAGTADILAHLLQAEGYEVRLAQDAVSALAVAEAEVIDVVLLDIGLPGMDGYEVARRLRNLGPKQSRRCKQRSIIIAVTGYGGDAERLRSYAVGMDLHLVKPIEPAELLRILKRIQAVSG
jgi:CheY-like chemotaxis protein